MYLQTHKEFNTMEAVCVFLQFVPMEDEVLEFFRPVAADILKKLKAKSCVPTQPNSQGNNSTQVMTLIHLHFCKQPT